MRTSFGLVAGKDTQAGEALSVPAKESPWKAAAAGRSAKRPMRLLGSVRALH